MNDAYNNTMDLDVTSKATSLQILPTPKASPTSSETSLARKLATAPTPDNPLRVVVIHGDPTKPNDILPGGKWDEDDYLAVARAREALEALGESYQFTWLCNHDTLIDDLRSLKRQDQVDLVLQLCDEGWMNNSRMELHITALLEMLDIPFTGLGSTTMGISYDKQAVLKIAESIGVPVPKSFYVEDGESYDPARFGLEFPVFVKPNSTDGSFGITAKSVCYSLNDVSEAIKEIREVFHVSGPILIQEYLTGRDVNVGVMEKIDVDSQKSDIWILPISEEDYSALPEGLPKICGFESKWDESSPYYQIKTRPTTLPAHVQQEIGEYTKRLFRRIDCRDYARFDWRLDGNGRPRLLEANGNCGWCWDGHLPKTAALCGISYPQFFEMILTSARHRAYKRSLAQEKAKERIFIQVGRNGAENLINISK